jgi:ATP-dependent DNA helicase RecQ
MTALEILKQYWGYDSFREKQEEIIDSVLAGRDTLALLPTGGGKSVCFQIPALMQKGICIVVTPLIALMRDQVDQLTSRGIKAIALYSGMSAREIDHALDNCVYGNYKFLYVSPERLQSELFLARAEKMSITLLAIDEAHCISQWGFDFRPPYLQIAKFRTELQIDKIIAVTATATSRVQKEIIEKLEMTDPMIVSKSFARANLSYSVFNTEKKEEKLIQILRNVPGSSIVYVRSRKATKILTSYLMQHQINADFYHAGLNMSQRIQRQQRWVQNHTRVIISTNAFGMGIDKPDVRTVIHMDLPDSMEAYYQEAGRAGRDEKKAFAILLYQPNDLVSLKERTLATSPDLELIKRVYQALANRYKLAIGSGANTKHPFDYQEFTSTFNLPSFETYYALKKLENEGMIEINEGFQAQSKLFMLLDHQALYDYQIQHATLDHLVKAIMRLYGGEIFTDYVVIQENEVARYLKTGKGQVIKWLEILDHQNVLEYQKATLKSQLTFVMPRQDTARMPIDREQLKERLAIELEKGETMVQYATSDSKCRSRMLQTYFGEETDENCGVCDYCLHQKKLSLKVPESVVLDAISEKSISVEKLIATIGCSEDELLPTIQQLVEKGKLKLINENRVEKL